VKQAQPAQSVAGAPTADKQETASPKAQQGAQPPNSSATVPGFKQQPSISPQTSSAPSATGAPKPSAPGAAAAVPIQYPSGGTRNSRRVPMTRMRQTIANRLKHAQNSAASLTTFNEIDMTNLMELRNKHKDEFVEKFGVKLGFMSGFVRAATIALQKYPDVNASIEGTDLVYHDFVDISVAVSTPTGLVVPVVRNCEQLGFHQIEGAINGLGVKARKNQLAMEDMTGGTFTISNGGVYGSLFGTPILNPPQSAILGMHGIFKRPVVVNDKVEIRPMMYVALTYDHRVIDGGGAVTFLKEIKANVEDPTRLLLNL
jgi:2-oxoglutarate dehydrogenase E2 component (dihydrolipoamide succinyltransferase)